METIPVELYYPNTYQSKRHLTKLQKKRSHESIHLDR